MRKDENGNDCPATLGEYRELCAAIGGEKCKAVSFLDSKIAQSSGDDVVIASDHQMRMLLWPMLAEASEEPRATSAAS